MRAIGVYNCGGPEALQMIELPEPHAVPGQVRISVRAATVNPVDAVIRAGAAVAFRTASPPSCQGKVPGQGPVFDLDLVCGPLSVTAG